MRRLVFFAAVLIASSASGQVTPPGAPALQPFDSMAYYNSTKKPAINEQGVTEYAPTIQADGKTIIFQRALAGQKYDLYQSQLENGKWSNLKSLEVINKAIDSTDLVGGPSLSFDGNTLYFFRSIGMHGDHEIFYAERTKEGWGPPQNLGAPINTEPVMDKDKNYTGGYEAFPSVSADGSSLYFVRFNEAGPQDKLLRKSKDVSFCTSIYKATKGRDGKWNKPEKLPWPVNQDCEKAPRIMADGRTLIFSSNRMGGKGGYDMYQTTLNDLNEWGLPVALNFVNTEKDEQLPCISAEGDLMYYTYNNSDIYSVIIPPSMRQFMNNIVQGFVTDQDSGAGIGARIIVTDALTSEVVMNLENNPADGRYTLVLPVGRSFNIEYKSDEHSSFTYPLDLRKVKVYQETGLDVKLFRAIRLSLNISDKELLEPIGAEVKLKVKGSENFLTQTTNNAKTGHLTVDLPVGSEYEVVMSASNYKSESLFFDFRGLVIYRDFERFVELVPLRKEVMVNVSDLSNNSKVKSRIILKNKNRDEVIEVSGNQMVSLRAGDRYEMEVTSDQGYAFNSTTLDLTKGDVPPVEVKLLKLEVDAKLTLRDINFESNSVQLSDISFTELKRVIQLMQENPRLSVEVAAFTDDVGSENYNATLSQQRANSVGKFLIENKIPEARFVAKGYGEAQAKVPNDSDVNRAANRRVELRILGI